MFKIVRFLFSFFVSVVLTSIAFARATEKTLFTFTTNSASGSFPLQLTSDSAGNLYGMAQSGGDRACRSVGCGLVFKLSPTAQGPWKETVLHTFESGADGAFPGSGLTFDSAGNLYGVTPVGGAFDAGVVFELSPTQAGPWIETILYTFTKGTDGGNPAMDLVFDNSGNVYGTAGAGGDLGCRIGSFGCGVVFELSPDANGGWQETVLHTFEGLEGSGPIGGLALDSSGNVYGIAINGGSHTLCRFGCGVAFELSPDPAGGWTYSVLRAFSGGKDGRYPEGPLVVDASGNLYGKASAGGNPACSSVGCGLIYELTPTSKRAWKETVIHDFNNSVDGSFLIDGVVLDPAGNLYGATFLGGLISDTCPQGCGRVFELSETSSGKWKETNLYGFKFGADGGNPYTNLLRDGNGNLFGAASSGTSGTTEIFEITP
jgi:hypothetical protein